MIVYLELLLAYLDSLKWAVLIGWALYYFRAELKEILKRPIVAKHGGTSIEFQTSQVVSDEDQKTLSAIENKSGAEVEKILEENSAAIKDKDQQILKLTLEKHFEYTYRIIFLSQIILLKNLDTFADGLPSPQVEIHFSNQKNNFDIYKDWTVEIYLKFLYAQNLIERDEMTGKIKITTIGSLFLKYLTVNNYNFLNEKTF